LANAAERHVLGLERGDAEEGGGLTSGLAERMEAFLAECLRHALAQCRGDIKAVMELLQLPRRTLNEKMLRHGLSRSDFVAEEPTCTSPREASEILRLLRWRLAPAALQHRQVD
ncbi:helix-turn-helix domain-containing protein, partial [Pseudomonas aeruginosa]|uniref:helix-turn-helix domain-containing protein n=1 Tax=Pseudomonas aeruginosa TaxID=287 RepID=UPI003CF5BC83